MPSMDPLFGNLVVSVTHRPYSSTFGPWLPGHWYQKSSTLTYWNPTPARPLFFIASACASILAAVGPCRMKLQLLHPNAGVSPTPLFSVGNCALDDPLLAAWTLSTEEGSVPIDRKQVRSNTNPTIRPLQRNTDNNCLIHNPPWLR